MNEKKLKLVALFMTVAIALSGTAAARAAGPLAEVTVNPGVVTWIPLSKAEGLSLTISGPNNFYQQKQYAAGAAPSFVAAALSDGLYTWELTPVRLQQQPKIDDARRGLESANIQAAQKQSGTVSVLNGAFVVPGAEEPKTPSAANTPPDAPNDAVTADDAIITGGLCVGPACIDGESFGSDNIRMKDLNTRLNFDDTSVGEFPANDWRIIANDSSSGGASYLAIQDVTAAKTPFKVMANAPTNSLYINSEGEVGFGTATPARKIHLVYGNTPGIRLDQDTSFGYPAQVWEMAGNELSFFVRDVTGNKLPLRIQTNAPDYTLNVKSDGKVGIGTWDPGYKLEVQTTGEDSAITAVRTDGATVQIAAKGNKSQMGTVSNHRFNLVVANSPKMTLDTTGNVGIGVSTPTHLLHLSGGAYSDGATWQDASSRELKENIKDLSPKEAVVALNNLNPVTFNYKADKKDDHVGFIAEDVPALVASKDRKGLSSMDIVAVLTRVVQEQQATINDHRQTIEQLSRKITELEDKIK